MTERALTDFEQVLLGMVVSEPRSGYELKKLFTLTPAAAYRPSSGALYPALRRLEQRGLLRVETATSAGRRNRRVWHPTKDGLTEHLSWLRQPVQPDRIAHELPLHLMRFVLMEDAAPREDVLAFLASLIGGLEQFVKGVEAYADGPGRQLPGRHPLLALRHGIVMHQASLDWARATAAELAAELQAWPASGAENAYVVGKSTTMRVILGLDRPDAGTAPVSGRPYRAPLRQVGSLLDAAAVQPSRTARNHLLWLAHSQGLPSSRVDAVIARADLD